MSQMIAKDMGRDLENVFPSSPAPMVPSICGIPLFVDCFPEDSPSVLNRAIIVEGLFPPPAGTIGKLQKKACLRHPDEEKEEETSQQKYNANRTSLERELMELLGLDVKKKLAKSVAAIHLFIKCKPWEFLQDIGTLPVYYDSSKYSRILDLLFDPNCLLIGVERSNFTGGGPELRPHFSAANRIINLINGKSFLGVGGPHIGIRTTRCVIEEVKSFGNRRVDLLKRLGISPARGIDSLLLGYMKSCVFELAVRGMAPILDNMLAHQEVLESMYRS